MTLPSAERAKFTQVCGTGSLMIWNFAVAALACSAQLENRHTRTAHTRTAFINQLFICQGILVFQIWKRTAREQATDTGFENQRLERIPYKSISFTCKKA